MKKITAEFEFKNLDELNQFLARLTEPSNFKSTNMTVQTATPESPSETSNQHGPQTPHTDPVIPPLGDTYPTPPFTQPVAPMLSPIPPLGDTHATVGVVQPVAFMPANPQVAPIAETSDLDSAGLPWDERIHASTKAKSKDGQWRRRRNLSDDEFKAVETELRNKTGATGVAPAQPATPEPVQQPAPAPVVPPMPSGDAPVAPMQPMQQPVTTPSHVPPMPMPSGDAPVVPMQPMQPATPEPVQQTAPVSNPSQMTSEEFMNNLSRLLQTPNPVTTTKLSPVDLQEMFANITQRTGVSIITIQDIIVDATRINMAVEYLQTHGFWF